MASRKGAELRFVLEVFWHLSGNSFWSRENANQVDQDSIAGDISNHDRRGNLVRHHRRNWMDTVRSVCNGSNAVESGPAGGEERSPQCMLKVDEHQLPMESQTIPSGQLGILGFVLHFSQESRESKLLVCCYESYNNSANLRSLRAPNCLNVTSLKRHFGSFAS